MFCLVSTWGAAIAQAVLEERALNPEWARFGRGPAFASSSLSSASSSHSASTAAAAAGDSAGGIDGETQWIEEGECEWMIGNHCDEVRFARMMHFYVFAFRRSIHLDIRYVACCLIASLLAAHAVVSHHCVAVAYRHQVLFAAMVCEFKNVFACACLCSHMCVCEYACIFACTRVRSRSSDACRSLAADFREECNFHRIYSLKHTHKLFIKNQSR